MKIAVFDHNRVGVINGEEILDVTSAVPGADESWPPVFMNRLFAQWQTVRPMIEAARQKASPRPLNEVKLKPPVLYPSNIIAAPANYLKHVGELGSRGVAKVGQSAAQLGFFLKATSSLVGASGAILLPRHSTRRFDHESELAVIIGKEGKNITRERALEYVFGYSCLMDITMRLEPDAPAEERPTRKSFDTFTPLGPWIVTKDEIPDPQSLDNRLWVNGELRQEANTREMTVGVAELIELCSSVMTLRPGDIIASGTPAGVGPIKPGDSIRIELSQVGTMTLPVLDADEVSPKTF